MPRVKKTTKLKQVKAATKKEPVKSRKAVVPKKSDKLTVKIYNTAGKVTGSVTLPKAIFGLKPSNKLLAQYVRVYLANQRQGTQSTKTRAEVIGSTRKIYRQKGTGRARHGDRKAPIFVGGGVAHGPKPRDFSLKINKKQKKKAFQNALSARFDDIYIMGNLLSLGPKTASVQKTLKNLELGEKKILLVYPNDKSENLYLASRNLRNCTAKNVASLNTYDLLNAEKIIMAKECLETLEKKYADQ